MHSPKSIEIIRNNLESKGYLFENFRLGETKTSYTRIISPSGSILVLLTYSPIYPFATSAGHTISKDKLKSYELAAQLGIQIPKMFSIEKNSVRDEITNLKTFLAAEKLVIVKPSNGGGSRGLTLDISNVEQFKLALQSVFSKSQTALIQTQFIGEEVRFSTIDGVVRSALVRRKPFVRGNGHSSIEQLIQQENEERRLIVGSLVSYPQLDSSLIAEDLLRSTAVPQRGEVIELNKNADIKSGASIYNILADVHPGYITLVEKLARQFGQGFLAVDFMIVDYTVAPTDDNYIYLETNISPSLSFYYSSRDGNNFDIVEHYIAPMIEKSIINNT